MAESFIGVRRKPCRRIAEPLSRVTLESSGPWSKPSRSRGSKAKGHTFERKFAAALRHRHERGLLAGQLYLGQWLAFEDAEGPGWAQPDAFVVTPALVHCFEVKLTQNDGAWEQLRHLYAPLLEWLFERPVVVTQVCRNLLVDDGTIASDWNAALDGATFHWTR